MAQSLQGIQQCPFNDAYRGLNITRIVFYNCENLMDTLNNPFTRDDEFTPEGSRHWTGRRYYKKLKATYKALIATGGWEAPALAGLCEIENRQILTALLYTTPLHKTGYRVVHEESPDRRGIDVALLYRPDKFTVLHHRAIHVPTSDSGSFSRDILYIKGLLNNHDTLHIAINHWPSRYSGQQRTNPLRKRAATILRRLTDSIQTFNTEALIVAMGDFNDGPQDTGITTLLSNINVPPLPPPLVTLRYCATHPDVKGTLKYQAFWNIFDHIFVSSTLLNQLTTPTTIIFAPDFLLTNDAIYGGYKPHRSFSGFRYQNGYSDHLPVFIDINTSPR